MIKKLVLTLLLILAPLTAHAKTIKTAYFTIELPERFVTIQINDDLYKGKGGASTDGYDPWGNLVVAAGSMMMMQYAKSKSTFDEATTKKEFIKGVFSFFSETYDSGQKDYTKIEKPTVCEDNSYLTTVCMNIFYEDKESKIPINMYSYHIFFKKLSAGLVITYIDSNDEGTGRKAAQEIYEQIKRSNQKISEKTRYNR